MRWTAELIESVTIHNLDGIKPASFALQKAATELGFRVAATPDIASSDQLVDADGGLINADIFGWVKDGERWWEDRRLALVSPLPRACRYESEPFWCDKDGAHTSFPNRYLDALSFADFKKYVRAPAAIVVPVHLSFGQIAAASYIPIDPEWRNLAEQFAEKGELLAALARRYLASYAMIAKTQQWIPSDCRLSKREVECLRFAAIGKTDKEISIILDLSHATVRYHIQRAGEKLNAVNRSQSVFKAGQLGYLGAAA
jgi:DNA-binding CsgD family transcriptional regulator